jgi:hypothetical protein
MALPYTQHELDDLQCGNPKCSHEQCTTLVLHSVCHTKAPTWARYEKTRGVLIITCAAPGCDNVIAQIEVAP